MEAFYEVAYIISLIIAALTFVIFICVTKYYYQSINILPKALRFFLFICYFPFVLVNAFLTFSLALICLVYDTQYNTVIEIIILMIPYATQNIRNFFFTIILERILATVLLEKYNLSHKKILSVILILWSQGISFGYVLLLIYTRFVDTIVSSEVLTYSVFTIHALTLAVCLMLYCLNMKMYKITAFKVTLKKRHQILENVKVLAFMFPSILIYTLLAPLGAIITIFAFTYKFPPLPFCIGHIFNNLPHLLICIRIIWINRKNAKNATVKVVKNAMGKNLPVLLNQDNYFKNLQQLWK